jgi:hypothetical protein
MPYSKLNPVEGEISENHPLEKERRELMMTVFCD